MKEKGDFSINIFGGSQQINPSATTAVQNFYGDQFAKDKLRSEAMEHFDLSPEAQQFSTYIDKVEEMPRYLTLLASCESATDLAQVVILLMDGNSRLDATEVVKERFINRILPLAPQVALLERGNSVDNIRARINDALAKRPRKRT